MRAGNPAAIRIRRCGSTGQPGTGHRRKPDTGHAGRHALRTHAAAPEVPARPDRLRRSQANRPCRRASGRLRTDCGQTPDRLRTDCGQHSQPWASPADGVSAAAAHRLAQTLGSHVPHRARSRRPCYAVPAGATARSTGHPACQQQTANGRPANGSPVSGRPAMPVRQHASGKTASGSPVGTRLASTPLPGLPAACQGTPAPRKHRIAGPPSPHRARPLPLRHEEAQAARGQRLENMTISFLQAVVYRASPAAARRTRTQAAAPGKHPAPCGSRKPR